MIDLIITCIYIKRNLYTQFYPSFTFFITFDLLKFQNKNLYG
jgi:hypothetical protein